MFGNIHKAFKVFSIRADCIKNLLIYFGVSLDKIPNDCAEYRVWSEMTNNHIGEGVENTSIIPRMHVHDTVDIRVDNNKLT